MIKDIVLKNRSYRGFDESYKFTKEEMVDFVDTMRLCASSANIQPLKFYISYEHDEVAANIKILTYYNKRSGMHPCSR